MKKSFYTIVDVLFIVIMFFLIWGVIDKYSGSGCRSFYVVMIFNLLITGVFFILRKETRKRLRPFFMLIGVSFHLLIYISEAFYNLICNLSF